MLKFETIERLPESLLYSRQNKKEYSIICRDLIDNKILKEMLYQYDNGNLTFTAYKSAKDSVILNKPVRGRNVLKIFETPTDDALVPEMCFVNDRLIYHFGQDVNKFFGSKSILIRRQENLFEKNADITRQDHQALSFKMVEPIIDSDISLKHTNKISETERLQTTIRVELIRDEEKYLDPNMGSYLGNATLKYGDLKYTMHKENSRNGLSLVSRNIDKIVVTIATPLTENLELIHHRKSIMVYIKDAGLGGGSGGVGELEMTLEVYKLTEMRFKFPKGYLEGLTQNNVAYAENDLLVVFTREIGEITLYTDKGSIRIRTLPGMRINKRRLIGEEGDIFPRG